MLSIMMVIPEIRCRGRPTRKGSRAIVGLEKTWRANDRNATTREPEIVRALDLCVLLVESEHADLLTRLVRVEHDEPLELRDERAVVEVADHRVAHATLPRLRATYGTES